MGIIKKILENNKGKSIDFTLLFVLIIILCLGLITLSSASSYSALTNYDNSTYYLTKQMIFAILGVILMLIISTIDYKIYRRLSYLGYVAAILLMLAVFVPGLGSSAKGATRWINLGFTTIQPSEIMKIVIILTLATFISNNYSKLNNIKSFLIPGLIVIIPTIILYFQDHLSAAIMLVLVSAIVIIVSGIKLKAKIIVPIILIAIAAVIAFAYSDEYRMERIFGFLYQDEDITGNNWQPTQSLYAIGSGGLFGKGLGQSRQKYLWLPEAQNDFIFSIYAEEFGFVGSIILIFLLAYFIIRGMTIGLKCKDQFGMLITVGIISLFAVQFILNIAVVTRSMPTTGIPFPFFSSGGTSLLFNLMAMGIVLNVSREAK